jgi:MFS family permease
MKSSAESTQSIEQANYQHLIWDVAWFGLALAATSRFLSVYAIRLGANDLQIGLLASIPAIMLAFSSSLGAWWRGHFENSVRAQFWPGLFFRMIFLLPFFAPFFPTQWQPIWLLAAASLPALVQGIAAVNFVILIRESVSDRLITPLMSRRSLAVNVCVAIGVLVFGVWLEKAPFPLNYQVMFLAAFALSLGSQWRLCGIRVLYPISGAARKPTQEAAPAPKPMPTQSAWRSPKFQQVALVAAILHIAFFSVQQVIPIHLVDNLGASEGFMALYGLAELSAGAAVGLLTTRIVRRIGNRNMIGLAMLGTALSAVVIALSPNMYFTLIGAALSGASWTAAAAVGLFGFFTENTPPEEMQRYAIAYHQAIGLALFVGPLIGGLLANGGMNLVVVLLLGAGIRLFGGALVEHGALLSIGHKSRAMLAARVAK